MKHKIHGQMSDSFLTAAFLSVSGGLQDAYTHTYSVEKYLPMQNIVLLSQSIAEKELASLHFIIFVPLVFFALGIAVSNSYTSNTVKFKNSIGGSLWFSMK